MNITTIKINNQEAVDLKLCNCLVLSIYNNL